MTSQISAEPLTLINVFEIGADGVDTFAAKWRERLDIMAAKDGFISAKLYRAASDDSRFQLVNVAQWASQADFERAVSDPGFRQSEHSSATDTAAPVRANPGLYRMVAERHNGE